MRRVADGCVAVDGSSLMPCSGGVLCGTERCREFTGIRSSVTKLQGVTDPIAEPRSLAE